MTINLTQIRSDFDNGIIVSKQTLLAAIDYAIEVEKDRNSHKRMFEAACFDLGLINEKLGLDPDDGGAEAIIDAIEQLQAKANHAL